MLGSACVLVVGDSSRSSWTRGNSGETPGGAWPCRCRPTLFDDDGCTVGCVAGPVADSAEVV